MIRLGLALLVVAAWLAAGCAERSLGYAGRNPGMFSCSGKVAITGTGTVALGVGYGGASTDSFSINGDCGDHFTIMQGMPPAAGTK